MVNEIGCNDQFLQNLLMLKAVGVRQCCRERLRGTTGLYVPLLPDGVGTEVMALE